MPESVGQLKRHVVGGVELALSGDLPTEDGARYQGAAAIKLHLETHETTAPLRPEGQPVVEVDSWAAFVDDERITWCLKNAAATPNEIMRVELPRTGLRGHAYYRASDLPLLFSYPGDQLLTIHALGLSGGVLAHAAAIAGRDGAFLATGPSGAGKSTLSGEAARLGGRVLSDERTVIRPDDAGGWILGGTPWPGEGGFAHNSSAPLRGILFLEQADVDEWSALTPGRALALLYRCHFPPLWDAAAAERVLDNLQRLVQSVPCWRVRNRRGPATAERLLAELGGPLATP